MKRLEVRNIHPGDYNLFHELAQRQGLTLSGWIRRTLKLAAEQEQAAWIEKQTGKKAHPLPRARARTSPKKSGRRT